MCHDWLHARERAGESESIEEWTFEAEFDGEEQETEDPEERDLTEAPADD